MNILEKTGCTIGEGNLITIGGPIGSGITSILCIIATELAMSGKNVLYFNNDSNFKHIVTKFRNLVPEPTELRGTLKISSSQNITKVVNDSKDVDVVVIDSYYGNKIDYKTLADNNKLTIIEMKQLALNINSEPLGDSYNFGSRSDCIITVSRNKTVKKLSFFDKFKNKFCFWIPEILEMEDITLKVVKNRRGATGTYQYPINFGEINKR